MSSGSLRCIIVLALTELSEFCSTVISFDSPPTDNSDVLDVAFFSDFLSKLEPFFGSLHNVLSPLFRSFDN